LIGASLIGLLAISVYRFAKFRAVRQFIIQVLVIGACFGFLYFHFYAHEQLIEMNPENDEPYFTVVLYLCMLLGMAAQYGYNRFTQPEQKRPKFDLGLFVAPIFASPIVFIPLLAALQNAEVDLQDLTTAKMMVFFVAFENGFFWKAYFDNRRKEIEDRETES
jgi:peptidoglycan/LPS O-acetylase OafA/YrhL